MELNSIEAIKMQFNQDWALLCLTYERVTNGVLHCTHRGVVVKRTLWLIFNPNRYRSKAEAFSREQVCHNRMEQGDVGVATGTNRCFKGCSS